MWLTGWSLPDSVFDQLRLLLPDFHHISAEYSNANSPEELLPITETTIRKIISRDEEARPAKLEHEPLLLAGWSLGSLLALKLAAKGYGDGLILFSATAHFTHSTEMNIHGWSDAHIRGMIRGILTDRVTVEARFRQLMFMEEDSEYGIVTLPPAGSWTSSALIAGLQILRNEQCLSELPHIDIPVLLVHGIEDKVCPYDAVLEIVERLPRATLIALPNCGHVPFLGKEAHIVKEIRGWWHDKR